MTSHDPKFNLVDSVRLMSATTYNVGRPLTPPRSSSSSQIATLSDPSHGTSVYTPLIALSEVIRSSAHALSNYYTANSLPQPSFDLNGPEDYSNDIPDEIQEVRARLRSANADMQILAAGPKENIMWMAWSYHDVALLHFVSQFKIAEAVPLHGTISIEEVSIFRPEIMIDTDDLLRL